MDNGRRFDIEICWLVYRSLLEKCSRLTQVSGESRLDSFQILNNLETQALHHCSSLYSDSSLARWGKRSILQTSSIGTVCPRTSLTTSVYGKVVAQDQGQLGRRKRSVGAPGSEQRTADVELFPNRDRPQSFTLKVCVAPAVTVVPRPFPSFFAWRRWFAEEARILGCGYWVADTGLMGNARRKSSNA